jgi:type I restriction enzyme S subunit
MSEWHDTTIGDLGAVVTGSTPSSKHPDWFGDVLPFVTPSDMTFGDRRPRPDRWLSQSGRDGLRTRVVPPGSSAFVCIGATIGKVCLMEAEVVTNQQINTVVPGRDTDGRFLYSLLRYLAPVVAKGASGAATPIINKSAFSAIPARVPDIATQIQIGNVLGSIDDLIENNRRRVEVLEEMARAIYGEWFVKFRYPGHEDVPLVDSALGPIPEAWSVGTVGSLGRVVTGSTPSTKQPSFWGTRGDTPFLTPSEMGWQKLLATPQRYLSDAGVANLRGRLLPAGAVCFACIGSIGKICVTVEPCVTNQQVNSLIVDLDVTSKEFAYEALGAAAKVIKLMASGAATPIINKSSFERIRLVVPPAPLAHRFSNEVGPLHMQILGLERLSKRLAEIRDLLLPKLVTGQIDVSTLDLDALLEGAVS